MMASFTYLISAPASNRLPTSRLFLSYTLSMFSSSLQSSSSFSRDSASSFNSSRKITRLGGAGIRRTVALTGHLQLRRQAFYFLHCIQPGTKAVQIFLN